MLALARLAGNEENFSFMIAALFELGWAGLGAGLGWAGLGWAGLGWELGSGATEETQSFSS